MMFKTRLLIGLLASTVCFTMSYAETSTPSSSNINTSANQAISQTEIEQAQQAWGEAIVAIGKAYQDKADYKQVASEAIAKLYGYSEGKVLFKPTKAAEVEFRDSQDEALSYFVGGIDKEDHGFALQPWSEVRFQNDQVTINTDTAEAMGLYFFTDANTHLETKVEYSFGYKRAKDGHLVIFLHHSSLPYTPPKATHS